MTDKPEPPDEAAGAGFATRAIHAGQHADPATGATVTPLYLTSVFTYDSVGVHRGYEYSRHSNPTRTALEQCLAALEGGEHAFCFASGVAASDAVFRSLRPGDHVLLAEDLYGGTYAQVEALIRPMGVEVGYADACDAGALAEAMRPNTRLVWIETPSNPLLRITDIAACAGAAHEVGALLCVDNTFASPALQTPLSLGADVVMHSTTKYLGGHSDLIGGAVITSNAGMAEWLEAVSRIGGAIAAPFDCWLTLRGVKTLQVRMRQHCANASAVADWLRARPDVARVWYPGFEDHPGHATASRQMRGGFGGMVAAELAGGGPAAVSLLNGVRTFALTGSLGGVESILSYPWQMSHKPLSPEERLRRGVTPGVVRLSVGLEEVEDLMADLDQALAGA